MSDLYHDAGTLVPAEKWEYVRHRPSPGLYHLHEIRRHDGVAGRVVVVRMAHACDRQLHQHLTLAGRIKRDLVDLPLQADSA
jgi:hypothetical protein